MPLSLRIPNSVCFLSSIYRVLKSFSLEMTLLEFFKRLLKLPLDALLLVLLLPVLVIEYVIGGLTILASIGSLLQCDDKMSAFKFITAYQTGALLKAKFPNSIAVRS